MTIRARLRRAADCSPASQKRGSAHPSYAPRVFVALKRQSTSSDTSVVNPRRLHIPRARCLRHIFCAPDGVVDTFAITQVRVPVPPQGNPPLPELPADAESEAGLVVPLD